MVRILKSIPIVVINEGVQASSQNRRRRQDLPTPVRRVRVLRILWQMEGVQYLLLTGITDEKELHKEI